MRVRKAHPHISLRAGLAALVEASKAGLDARLCASYSWRQRTNDSQNQRELPCSI
jgi:hypothetical protein